MASDRKALLFGLFATAALSATLTVAGLKAGISPGVSPLVVLIAWAAFSRRLRGRGGEASRFLNIAQVAGSGGMAVTAGVIFTAPLLQILAARRSTPSLEDYEALRLQVEGARGPELEALQAQLADTKAALLAAVPPVDVPTLIVASLVGAAIGWGFVGLSARRFLSDPTLPAPEAKACRTLIDAAVSRPEARPRLVPSLLAGALFALATRVTGLLGLAREGFHFLEFTNSDGSRKAFGMNLSVEPIFVGIGGLLTFATAVAVFSGGAIRAVADCLLATIDPSSDPTSLAARFPATSARWIGGAAMTVAVLWSLVNFARAGRALAAESSARPADDPLLDLRPGNRPRLFAAVGLGALAVVAGLLVVDGPTPFALAITPTLLATTAVMVVLGALLSLQIGSSASPVSGTVFVTTLVLCLVAALMGRRDAADVAILTPLLVAACVAVCAANDSSQDYRTLHLCGLAPREGFKAQFLGLLVGALVVPPALYVAHNAYVLGSTELRAPQGDLFATVVDSLLLGGELPLAPILIGAVLGVAAVAVEVVGRSRGLVIPAMALAVGMYLPPELGVGILIGGVARRLGEGRNSGGHRATLTAAGLVTGAAGYELALGIVLLVTGLSASAFELDLFGEDSFAPIAIGGGAIVLMVLALWSNARADRARG
ncbi:MAG: OPT/YSL family transporter [Planctomycetota bacterium]